MWLNVAKKYLGTQEIVGPQHNPTVVKMYSDVGFPNIHDDETAWCAAFVGSVLKEDGQPYLRSLSARSYLSYGTNLSDPREGCIVVFWRGSPNGWMGHVGFVNRFDEDHLYVIGGNQNNQVNETRFPKTQVLAYRWPNEIKKDIAVTQQVVEASTKLSVLQRIRQAFIGAGAFVSSLFTFDTLNQGSNVLSTVKTAVAANMVPIAVVTIVLGWVVLKWFEKKSVDDFKEGRYVPSGMTETTPVIPPVTPAVEAVKPTEVVNDGLS